MDNCLIKLFDKAAGSPEFIPKLRQLILDLAVRGKLVNQNPGDEPASALLKKIKAEKEKLVKEGKIRPEKAMPQISNDEIPFQIPKNWEWTSVSHIAKKVTDGEHLTPMRTESGYYLLSARNITNEGISLTDVDHVPEEEFIRIRKRCNPDKGDVLLSCSGSVGRVAVVDKSNTYVMVRSAAMISFQQLYLDSFYLAITLKAPWIQKQVLIKSRTTAQANIFIGKIKEILFPLPPLAEQKRIVAKVDELMALCDELEAVHQKKYEERKRLNLASLKAVTDAKTPEDFKDASSFFINHLTEITVTQEHVKHLRQSILDLAITGKLTDKWRNGHKNKSVNDDFILLDKNIKKKKTENSKGHETLINCTPKSWKTPKLNDLFKFIDYRGKTPIRTNAGKRLITAKNIKMGYISDSPIEYIADDIYSTWMTRGFPQKGDIFFVVEGATMGCVSINNREDEFALAQRTLTLQPLKPFDTKIFLYFIMSPHFQKMVSDNATGTAVAGIKSAKFRDLPMPLPPLSEQKEIVAMIDKLMSLCDDLEKQISLSSTHSTRLLNALLQEDLEN